MNDAFERLRAANPQRTTPGHPADTDVTAVLAAARSAGGRHPAPPTRMGRRTVLLGAAAVAVGAAAVPASGMLARSDRMPKAQAAMLKDLAHRLAALPPAAPGRDVIYLKLNVENIDLHSFSSDGNESTPRDPWVRTKAKGTDERWVPLWPNREQGTYRLRGTSTLLTAADARRFAKLPEELRRPFGPGGPPWTYDQSKEVLSQEGRQPGSVTELTRSFVQKLPTDPAALESVVRKDLQAPPTAERVSIPYELALANLLLFIYTPPKVRAAALVLLAKTDGSHVKVLGERQVAGRTALVMWREHLSSGEEILIDSETGLELGRNRLLGKKHKRESSPWYDDLPVGTHLQRQTLLEFAYVGKVGQRP